MHAELSNFLVARRQIVARLAALVAGQAAMPVLITAGCLALFAYLLSHYPYAGLYGQDSFAYYFQTRALLDSFAGVPQQPFQLFSAESLNHWPLGYHLHLMLGMLLTPGLAGGRLITLLLAACTPALVYLVVREVWPSGGKADRMVAGIAAAVALPLTATFTRTGLSLMSDVPAMFWTVLAVYTCLRAWPSTASAQQSGALRWQFVTGLAVGLTILIRLSSALLILPLALYVILCNLQIEPSKRQLNILPAVGGLILALLPQIAYLLLHPGDGAAYGSWLGLWSPTNWFSSVVSGPDGTARFAQPMALFYLIEPLLNWRGGFMPFLYIPCFLLGVVTLIRAATRPLLVLLLAWLIVPALFFAGTPYQTHRYALLYLPALLAPFGVGVAVAARSLLDTVRSRTLGGNATILRGLVAAAMLLATLVGAVLGFDSVRDWMAWHAGQQNNERALAALVVRAAGAQAAASQTRVVSFGNTAALYYYTGWPLIELYNSDTAQLEQFLAASGKRLIVLPEASMSMQWLGTPVATRWNWLQTHYELTRQGNEGEFVVYSIGAKP